MYSGCHACRDGDIECVKVLVAAGADATAVTAEGHSAYDLAAACEWSASADPAPLLKVLQDVGAAAVKPVVADAGGAGGADAVSTDEAGGNGGDGGGGKPIDVAAVMAAKKAKKKRDKADGKGAGSKEGPSMAAYIAVGLLGMMVVVPFFVIVSEYIM